MILSHVHVEVMPTSLHECSCLKCGLAQMTIDHYLVCLFVSDTCQLQ